MPQRRGNEPPRRSATTNGIFAPNVPRAQEALRLERITNLNRFNRKLDRATQNRNLQRNLIFKNNDYTRH
jgi:hypothetical protein